MKWQIENPIDQMDRTNTAGSVKWEIREASKEEKTDWGRIGSEILGGIMGGAVGAGSPVPGGTYFGIGLGAEGAGQVYDKTRELMGGKKDTRGLPEQLTSAASNVMLQAAVPKAFDVGAPVAKNIIMGPLRVVKNKMANAGSKQLLSDYTKAGVRPMAGPITGNRAIQGTEDFLSGNMFSAKRMQETASGMIDDTGKFANKVSSEYGPVKTIEGLGETAKKAAGNVIDKFKHISNIAYKPLDDAIPGDTIVPVENTVEALTKMIGSLKKAPASQKVLASELIAIKKTIMEDIKASSGAVDGDMFWSGGLPYNVLRRWRSKIGEAISGGDPVPNIGRAQLNRLYGALAEDSKAVAKQAGLSSRIEAADKYYKFIQTTELPIFKSILKTKTPEDVFNVVMQSSAKGGSRLRTLRRRMSPAEWSEFSGTLLHQIGLARPGAQDVTGKTFSPSTFLTNWSKMSPEAKTALWGKTKNADLKLQLDRLVRIAGSQKDINKIINSSNTGRFNAIMNLLTAAGGVAGAATGGAPVGVGSVATIAGAPAVMAKLMTSKWFIKWMADGAKIAKSTPNNLGSHMARLWVSAEKNDMSNEVYELFGGERQQSTLGGN